MEQKKWKRRLKMMVFVSIFLGTILLTENASADANDVYVEPDENKWEQITTTEEAMIPISKSLSLRYNFGPIEALGQPFGEYSPPNLDPEDTRKPTDKIAPSFVTPNATFVDTNTDSRIHHLYSALGAQNKDSTKNNPPSKGFGSYRSYLSLQTSLGLFYANGKKYFLDTVPVNEFLTGNVQYFKQVLSNGLTAYKVAYNVEFPINEAQNPRKDHIEIIMTGKKNGRVNIRYRVTNTGESDENVVVGASFDTAFKRSPINDLNTPWTSNANSYEVPDWLLDSGIDNVPIKAVGDEKGVYIETKTSQVNSSDPNNLSSTSDNKYILKYLFDIPGAIDNWTGRQFIPKYISEKKPDMRLYDLFGLGRIRYYGGVPQFDKNSDKITTLSRFNQPFHFFSHPTTAVAPFTQPYLAEAGNGASDMPDLDSTGDEARKWEAGAIVKEGVDTAIHMKTQPKAVFNSNDTITFSYDVVVGMSGSAPTVMLDQKDQELTEGSSFDISGTWSDEESFYVDLYYTLDNDKEKIYIAKTVDNPVDKKGDPIPWGRQPENPKVTIPADKLPVGVHTITVYAKDSEGNVSQPEQVKLTVKVGKADVKVRFMNEKEEEVHKDVIFPEQKIGSTISINTQEIREILDRYKKDYMIEGPLDNSNQKLDQDKILVSANGTTVTYRISGIKQLIVPEKIDFETQIAAAQEKIVEDPVIEGKLAVRDTRADKKSWNISARMKEDLTNRENGRVIKNLIQYRKKVGGAEQLIPLANDFQTIATGTNQALEYSVSDQWAPSGDGVKLKFKRTDLQSLGEYDGVIEWNIVDGPDGKLLP